MQPFGTSRRQFLSRSTFGVGGVALAWLLEREGLLAAPPKPEEPQYFDMTPKPPHFEPKAKAMISLFMQGGPSHMDLLDPKPLLNKRNGESYAGELKLDNAAEASRVIMGSPWKFAKHGQSGTEVSELLPHLSKIVDDICLIRSMASGSNNHGPGIYAMNTGREQRGMPALGSWLTYGLGSANQNLPGFVVLTDPDGLPVLGVDNWWNGPLPSLYQGTVARPREPRILNLDPPARLAGEPQRQLLSLIGKLNANHKDSHPLESDLDARIASFELAARMQTVAKEAFDLSQESAETHKLYGTDDAECGEYGRRCLIARRLVERGVRFVQIYTRYQLWDHHGSIKTALPKACKKTDQPAAALVADLKRRGLLDSTLVHWGGEMGRLPVIQNTSSPERAGRDHNTYGFSMWLAGGGIKGGMAYGATDEFGHKTIEKPVTPHDYHTTLLHLFGLDPKRLVFRQGPRELALVEGAGQVVKEILA